MYEYKNIQVSDKSYALHHAAKSEHFDVIKALLIHGAIYNAETSDDKKPIDLTTDKDVKRLLDVINKCFYLIKTKKTDKIVTELNKINDFELLKAIVRAKNVESETIMLAAIRNSLPSIEDLRDIKQEINGSQMSDTIEKFKANGQYSEEIAFLTKVRQSRFNLFGENCPGNLRIDSAIFNAIVRQKKLHEALQMCDELMKKEITFFGENTVTVAQLKLAKVSILLQLKKTFDALELLQLVEKKHKHLFETNCTLQYDYMSRTALAYKSMGNYEGALEAEESCYSGYCDCHCKHSNGALNSSTRKISYLIELKRFGEVLNIARETYNTKVKILGPDHAETLDALHNMSLAYLCEHKLDQALEVQQRIWKQKQEKYGKNHLEALKTQLKTSVIMLMTHSKEFLGLKYLVDGLAKLIDLLGPNHPEVVKHNKMLNEKEVHYKFKFRRPIEFVSIINTELKEAAFDGNLNEIKRLLDLGADVNGKNAVGQTPLHLAVDKNNKDVVEFLLEHSANPLEITTKGNTLLHTVALAGHVEMAEIVLKHVKNKIPLSFYDFINAQTKNGKMTALHVAAKCGHLNMVMVLLKHGAIFEMITAKFLKPIEVCTNQDVIRLLSCCDDVFSANQQNTDVLEMLQKMKQNTSVDFMKAITSARNVENKTVLNVVTSKLHLNQKKELITKFLSLLR